MSGSGLARGGGGVGWQVDLPGLASLVLNLGTAGLKRFAEAGVDFHTVLCMGEIAEKCPASNKYRKELSVCRHEQRKQAQWLFKIVEIGAATNFVADELLKQRAGENVVALMSTILPVMSESSCDNLLLKLFEASAAPLDKTPGFSQLRSIRETLTPLARKTQFKDRVFQYHVLARQLLEDETHTFDAYAYESIPDESTAVQVILSLAKLMQTDTGTILEYHGLKGAGWVIAYASHVLGLPVCILKSSSSTVPISGDYQNAKIFVHIFELEGRCQLLTEGKVEDFFLTKSIETLGQHGWVIDAENTSVLDSYIPRTDPIRKGISLIVRSMVNDYTKVLSESFSPPSLDLHEGRDIFSRFGLVSYPTYCLPAIRKRAQKNLELLGFDLTQAESTDPEVTSWSQYVHIWKHFQTALAVHRQSDGIAPYLTAGPMWIKSDLGHTETHQVDEQMKAEVVSQGARFNDTGVRYIKFLLRMVDAACWLAFTDWDQHLRFLSVSFLESHGPWRGCLLSKRALIEILAMNGPSGQPCTEVHTSVVELCKASIDVIIGGRQSWTSDFGEDKLLAFQHWGVVFVQNAALQQNLDLDACFLHLIPGAIAADGERQNRIYNYSPQPKARTIQASSLVAKRGQQGVYKPVDHFPALSVTTRGDVSAEGIILKQTVLVGNDVYSIPGPGSTSKAVRKLFVTKPCGHHYYDELSVSRSDMQQGLFLAGTLEQRRESEIWLQSVDQNPLGQWLAYQTFKGSELTFLQRDCCLACLLTKIHEVSKTFVASSRGRKTFRIIHGRLAGEHME